MARLPSVAVAIFVCAVALVACDGQSDPSAERLPPQTYVPLVDVPSLLSGAVHHFARQVGGFVYSGVVLLTSDPNARYGVLSVEVACGDDELEIYLFGLPDAASPGDVEVLLGIDGEQPQAQSWQGLGVLGLELTGERADQLYAELRSAQRLTVTIPEVQIGPTDLPIEELFNSPIQDNLDYCGDYHPTDRRVQDPDYVPLVGENGSTVPHITYDATESTFGSRTVLTTTVRVAPESENQAHSDLRIALSCNNAGATSIRLEGLPQNVGPHESLDVSIKLDDAVTTTHQWRFQIRTGTVIGEPESPGLISGLLLGSRLSLTVRELGIEQVQFNLEGLFETPVQGNLDHCGHYAPS